MKNPAEQQAAAIIEDEKLGDLLKLFKASNVPSGLDARMAASYIQTMSQLQAKSVEANIDLRKAVALSLVRVFAFTVFLTALVILLIGFGLINLPTEVIHILLASTIAQAVVLYRRVIAEIFNTEAGKIPH